MRALTTIRPRPIPILALAAAATVLAVAAFGPTASAHGDEGEMELTRFEQTGPDRVEVEVGIVYENDGHLSEDASATAMLTHDDGTTVGPVELEHRGAGTGFYAAGVDLPAPGTWTVAVTSTGPDASVEGSLVVEDTPATTEAPTTTQATDDTSVVSPPTDDLATAVDDDSGNFVLVLVIALLVIAAVGGGVWWARRDRAQG